MAEGQRGLVSLSQLETLGLTASGIRDRVSAGRLHRINQGVYAVGHPLLTVEGRRLAAVLACGEGAVLSHRSAAALWGIHQMDETSIDVTAPNRRGRAPRGITAHRDGKLHPEDCSVAKGVPCTSVARTLLDLGGVVGFGALRRAVSEAEVQRLLDRASISEAIGRNRGRRGVARLRLIVSELAPNTNMTRSELERRVLTLCAHTNLPSPELNVPIQLTDREFTADFLWRDARLILEADGRQFHDTASAFEHDRRRDQRLSMAGWYVIRCTWRQVTDEPTALAHTLRTVLARRRAESVAIADGIGPSAAA